MPGMPGCDLMSSPTIGCRGAPLPALPPDCAASLRVVEGGEYGIADAVAGIATHAAAMIAASARRVLNFMRGLPSGD
jgi:hypothetical protein